MSSATDRFHLVSDFELRGDQARAQSELVEGLDRGDRHQVLLGVTGSGKTFTMAQVIARTNRPTLVMAHNKTLAAQLYQEFKRFFPENAVEYFVSYYDYYQPEAYVPASDTYIEKESTINDEIDRMRLSATRSLFERRDVIIVASVSCIYGLGSPEAYYGMVLPLSRGQRISRQDVLKKLVEIQYERNDTEFGRGTFRVRGDTIEVFPSYEEHAVRIDLFGDEIDELVAFDPLTGKTLRRHDRLSIFPKSIYVTSRDKTKMAVETIKAELEERRGFLEHEGKLLEAQRLHQRTMFDLEMIREIGYCHGIENYSRHLTGRAPGEPPPTLLDYLPEDSIIFVDESHQTVPQVRGMHAGDRSRKEVLVSYGFRLPSALDNRPLNFEEWEARVGQVVYVSATPGPYELTKSAGVVVEQIIRPTGLMDPPIDVRPVRGQVDDLLQEIRVRAERHERVLVTTLTKKMSEDLTQVLSGARREGPLPAFGHRDAGAHRDPARSPARRLRRAGRHQPAARGAGPARGVAGGDSGRRQGGLPALGRLADPDLGPRRAKRQRPRHHVCRERDRLDAAVPERDRAAPGDSAGVQRRARHHAHVDREGHRRGPRQRGRSRLRAQRSDGRDVRGSDRPPSARRTWPRSTPT